MPSKKVAKEPPPVPGAAGLSVKSLPKPRAPRASAGWKMVNCSIRISVPNLSEWFPRTQVRLSVKTKLFCFSI
jgi:hypothetical protein